MGQRLTFGGCYKAQVSSNQDPTRQGRLRLIIPMITQSEVTDWAKPSRPWAANFALPAQGQLVWVMFEAGDPDHPVWLS